MTHKEATNYLRRFYYSINTDPSVRAVLKRNMVDPTGTRKRKVFGISGLITGLYDPNAKKNKIHLNPSRQRFGGIVKACIHELLHHIHYDKNEVWVLQKETEIYDALSDRQLTNLMRKIFT